MNKNFTVVKANELILSKYNLSVEEQRIILTLASVVQPNDKEFYNYEFKIDKFIKLLEVEGQNKYTIIPQIIDGLMKKIFKIKKENKIDTLSWLSFYSYNQGLGSLTLRFDPALKPYLLNLKENFTSYKLGNVLSLKKKYSIRIYEILKSNQFKKEVLIKIDELKSMFEIENEYKNYNSVRARIIEPAQKEINEKTDILIDYEEIKSGRKIIALKFHIIQKKGTQIISPLNDDIENLKVKLKELSEYDINKIYIESGQDYKKVLIAYEYLKLKQNVNNAVGYMIRLVREEKLKKPVKSTRQANFEQRNYTKEDLKDIENRLLNQNEKYIRVEIEDVCSNCTSDDCEHCIK